VAIGDATTVRLELDQLRALGQSGRAAALSAVRRYTVDSRPAASRPRPWPKPAVNTQSPGRHGTADSATAYTARSDRDSAGCVGPPARGGR
jgi:hypothetical protein